MLIVRIIKCTIFRSLHGQSHFFHRSTLVGYYCQAMNKKPESQKNLLAQDFLPRI